MYRLFLLFSLFVSINASAVDLAKSENLLNLGSWTDQFFEGDPLNTWTQPKDPRYKSADDPADSTKVDLLKLFNDAKSEEMRKELHDLRQKYIAIYREMENTPNADFIGLSKQFTDALMEWTKAKIEQAMPPSVSTSDFAFIGFGSMARKESGPITDLESALAWDPNFLDKDQRDELSFSFANNISRSMHGLLGHPHFGIKGFRTDEAGNFPLTLAPWARNYDISQALCKTRQAVKNPKEPKDLQKFKSEFFFPFEGSLAFASTPKRLADYVAYPYVKRDKTDEFMRQIVNTKWLTKAFIKEKLLDGGCVTESDVDDEAAKLQIMLYDREKTIVSLFKYISRNRALLAGNPKLFADFEEARQRILNQYVDSGRTQKRYQHAGLSFIRDLLDDFSKDGGSMFITGVLPKVLDLKRDIYRFDEQIFTNLGLYYNLSVQNTGDIVISLAKSGRMGPKLAREIYDRMNQMARLKWKGQVALNSQLPSNMDYIDPDAHKNQISKIKHEIDDLKTKVRNTRSDSLYRVKLEIEISELISKLEKLQKLAPAVMGAVLEEADIAMLRDNFMPDQAKLFRRALAFVGYYDVKLKRNMRPNPRAFLDNFDVKSVNADLIENALKRLPRK